MKLCEHPKQDSTCNAVAKYKLTVEVPVADDGVDSPLSGSICVCGSHISDYETESDAITVELI